MNNVLNDFFWCFKAKRGGVADVQLDDALAFFFETFGFLKYWSAYVVTDVNQFVGFADY